MLRPPRFAIACTDVYLAGGYYSFNPNFSGAPCYWKDGVRTDLPLLTNHNYGFVLSLIVSGSDVYAGGYSKDMTGKNFACYWENGARKDLDGDTAWSIFVTSR